VVISVDGGRTRIRYAKKGKRRPKTNRHGYVGEWQEPKFLTIYVVDEQGKRVNTTELPVTNDGTFGLVDPFMELLEMHLVRLGINQAKQVLLLADGAEWIWLRIPPLLKRREENLCKSGQPLNTPFVDCGKQLWLFMDSRDLSFGVC